MRESLGDAAINIRLVLALDLQQHGRRVRRGAQQRSAFAPINGAFAQPQVVVALGGIIVHMCGADVVLHHVESFAHRAGDVGVAGIEAESDVVKVRRVHQFIEPLGRGDLIGDILQQQGNAQRLGEGAQMLHRSHGGIEFARIETFLGVAQVLHQETEGKRFRHFQRPLDFVHGLDLALAVGLDHVDGSHGAAPLLLVEHGRMHGMKFDAAGLEPIGDLFDVRAILIIKMSAGAKNLDGFNAGASQAVQHAGMQALADEHVSRSGFLH